MNNFHQNVMFMLVLNAISVVVFQPWVKEKYNGRTGPSYQQK